MVRAPGAFAEFVRDALAPMGVVHVKRMFSGAGLWCDGLMFALVVDDVLYLKADDRNRPAFVAEGMRPFTYTARGRTIEIGHWRTPERLFDDPDELVAWARGALAAARAKAAEKARTARGKAAAPTEPDRTRLATKRARTPRLGKPRR